MLSTHLVLPCVLSYKNNTICSKALIDTGASGFAFIDADFVSHNKLPQIPLQPPRHLEVIDGRPISSGRITHTTSIDLVIDGHAEKANFYITKLGRYPIILGLPWMQYHDISIEFGQNRVQFKSRFCQRNCFNNTSPLAVIGENTCLPITSISAAGFYKAANRRIHEFSPCLYLRLTRSWSSKRTKLF